MSKNTKTVNLPGILLTLIVFGFIGYQLWLIWPQILLNSLKWQKSLNEELSDLLYAVKENNLSAGFYFIGLSFLYGVLHSVGPGHGKVVVTTFLATHPAKIKHGLILTILSALMQAIVAILLVSIFLIIFSHSMREVSGKIDYLIRASFFAMAILGGSIIWKSARKCFLTLKNRTSNHLSDHKHDELTASDINQVENWKSYAGIIISVGIRPCTGAIMVLLFSRMLEVYWLGIVSAILMAAGTAITTSTIALLTVSGKKVVQHYIAQDNPKAALGSIGMQFLGGAILLLLGLSQLGTHVNSVSFFIG